MVAILGALKFAGWSKRKESGRLPTDLSAIAGAASCWNRSRDHAGSSRGWALVLQLLGLKEFQALRPGLLACRANARGTCGAQDLPMKGTTGREPNVFKPKMPVAARILDLAEFKGPPHVKSSTTRDVPRSRDTWLQHQAPCDLSSIKHSRRLFRI